MLRIVCFCSFLLLLLIGFNAVAQTTVTDSTAQLESADTTRPVNFIRDSLHSPRKAMLLSAALPGLGQAYNKKYWKIPIVTASFATAVTFFWINNSGYSACKKAIDRKQDADPNNDNDVTIVRDYFLKKYDIGASTEQDLFTIKQAFRQNRDVSAMAIIGVYALNIVDAYVDAHLFNYDMSENLSVAPLINYNGVGLAISIK